MSAISKNQVRSVVKVVLFNMRYSDPMVPLPWQKELYFKAVAERKVSNGYRHLFTESGWHERVIVNKVRAICARYLEIVDPSLMTYEDPDIDPYMGRLRGFGEFATPSPEFYKLNDERMDLESELFKLLCGDFDVLEDYLPE